MALMIWPSLVNKMDLFINCMSFMDPICDISWKKKDKVEEENIQEILEDWDD